MTDQEQTETPEVINISLKRRDPQESFDELVKTNPIIASAKAIAEMHGHSETEVYQMIIITLVEYMKVATMDQIAFFNRPMESKKAK